MPKAPYYVDSCIWLNLFKKEVNKKTGILYGEIAKNFIQKAMFSEDKEIAYSGIILKEIRFKLADEKLLKEKELFFKDAGFKFIRLCKEDYAFGRRLESEFNYQISFYDCLNIAICKRLLLTLVTRDGLLLKYAKKYISAKKPEELL